MIPSEQFQSLCAEMSLLLWACSRGLVWVCYSVSAELRTLIQVYKSISFAAKILLLFTSHGDFTTVTSQAVCADRKQPLELFMSRLVNYSRLPARILKRAANWDVCARISQFTVKTARYLHQKKVCTAAEDLCSERKQPTEQALLWSMLLASETLVL